MGGHEAGDIPGDALVHSHPSQHHAMAVYHPAFYRGLVRNDGEVAVGHCGSPSHVGSVDDAAGVGVASLVEGATAPPPCPAQGTRFGLALWEEVAQRRWMAGPPGVAQGTQDEHEAHLVGAGGLPGPSLPALVLSGGALHPQQPSASLGSRHTHHEKGHQSSTKKGPSCNTGRLC